MPRRLLVTVCDFEQSGFAPWASQNLNASWQRCAGKAHWDGDGGKAGGWCNPRTIVAMRRVEIANDAGWEIPRRINKHVKPCFIHSLAHTVSEAALNFRHLLALWILIGRQVGRGL